MADVHTPAQRSRNMAAIHSQNTLPEEIVRKYLFSRGLRYRKNDPRLPGKPDIVFPKYNTVVFVNGCFWHAHTNCRYFVWPKNNESFWKKKITRNVERDNQNISELKTKGWQMACHYCMGMRSETSEKKRNIRSFAIGDYVSSPTKSLIYLKRTTATLPWFFLLLGFMTRIKLYEVDLTLENLYSYSQFGEYANTGPLSLLVQ